MGKRSTKPAKESVSENVVSWDDGYWQWFEHNDLPPYEITGKYLFFSTDRNLLMSIAIAAIERGGFHLAKTHMEGQSYSQDYVLCLYYKDDSRKHELARRYRNVEGVRYRYWKSAKETQERQYSEKFLSTLNPALKRAFKA